MRFAFNPFTKNLDLVDSGSTPGSVVEEVTGDSGIVVVPDVNGNINVLGSSSSVFSQSGITTIGTANTLTVTLTNRASGQVTTTNATPTTIITFPLGATAAVYSFTGFSTGRSTATGDGASYFLDSCFKTDGASATEIGTEDSIFFEDSSLTTANTTISASANNVIIQVVGVLATTINWDAVLTFRRVL